MSTAPLDPTVPPRFERMARLVGDDAMRRLFDCHVMVLGLGGVGSWAAEALARSGVGRLTLVDFDRVCVTNTNRQLPALASTLGRVKAEVVAERLRDVNPSARVEGLCRFYDARTAPELLAERPDFVVDAIDNLTAKCHLLATCRELDLAVVTSTGAAGRRDPTRVAVADLANTRDDPMAREVRKILRRKHGFPGRRSFGIPSVYSDEIPWDPREFREEPQPIPEPEDEDEPSTGRAKFIYGTAPFVTGTFGLVCASVVVRRLLDSR